MNEGNNNKSLFNFFTRSAILVLAVILVYHFTIGTSLTKIDRLVDEIVWFKEKTKSYDKNTFLKRMRELPSEFDLSDKEEQLLRSDTKKVLKSLSPILDELYLYEPEEK
jgi:hypothetical protein